MRPDVATARRSEGRPDRALASSCSNARASRSSKDAVERAHGGRGARRVNVNESYWAARAPELGRQSRSPAPRLMHELKQVLPGELPGLLGGDHQLASTSRWRLPPTSPAGLVKVRGGGIGPGLPGSLGAALAFPDKKVVGHLLGRRRDVLDHRALDGGSPQDPGDVRDAQQRGLSHPEAEHGRVPRGGGEGAEVRRAWT